MANLISAERFWLFWGIAFVGFPIAGMLSYVIGAVDTPTRAILAGAIAGATLGLVQWVVLTTHLSLPISWVFASSIGMAAGLAVSTAMLGSETAGNELLWRAAITGLSIGFAQWVVLRQVLPQSIIWVGVVGLAWVMGWFITRSIGVDLGLKWSVFGSAGAITFQLITGLALYFLTRWQ